MRLVTTAAGPRRMPSQRSRRRSTSAAAAKAPGSLFRKTEDVSVRHGGRDLCKACFDGLAADAKQLYTKIVLPLSKPPAWCDVCVKRDPDCKAIGAKRYHLIGEDFDLCEEHYTDECSRDTSGAVAAQHVLVERARRAAGTWGGSWRTHARRSTRMWRSLGTFSNTTRQAIGP